MKQTNLFTVGPRSLADLQKGSTIPGDSGSDPTVKPPWMNEQVYNPEQIRRFYLKNTFRLAFCWHCSLVIGFSLDPLLEALVFTQASNTPRKCLKRYTDTGAHLSAWHTGDIFDPSTSAFRSVQDVRSTHRHVRSAMDGRMPGRCWMSMYDMACVQSGFMGFASIIPRAFGLNASEEELATYVNFWRCVGYQLGVADDFNLCSLGKDTSDKIVWEFNNQVIVPDAADPPIEYASMAEAYIDGWNLLFLGLPVLSVQSTLAYTLGALGKPVPHLSVADHIRLACLKLLVVMLGWAPIAIALNWATRSIGQRGVTNQRFMDAEGSAHQQRTCSRLALVLFGSFIMLVAMPVLSLLCLASVLNHATEMYGSLVMWHPAAVKLFRVNQD